MRGFGGVSASNQQPHSVSRSRSGSQWPVKQLECKATRIRGYHVRGFGGVSATWPAAARRASCSASYCIRILSATCQERDFFIHNLLVRIHLIIEMILVDRPCAMRN